MHCPRCETYELNRADLYCGWCGTQQFRFSVEPPLVRFYVDLAAAEATARLVQKVQLGAEGSGLLAIGCGTLPAWLSVPGMEDLTLEGGKALDVSLLLDVARLSDVGVRAPDPVTFNVKDTNVSHTVQVETCPIPEVTIRDLRVFPPGVQGQFELSLETWSPFRVSKMEFIPPYLRLKPEGPREVDVGGGRLAVDVLLPVGYATAQQPIACAIHIEGLGDPIRTEFALVLTNPPRMMVPEVEAGNFVPEILPGDDAEYAITIANRGGENLIIGSVKVICTGEAVEISVEAIPPNLSVAPGQDSRVRLKLHCDADVPAGHYWFDLVFGCNVPTSDQTARRFRVSVKDEEYPDFVAVDFGTTDSAVAILDPGRVRPENLLLEKGSTKIYSNIFFMDYDENRPLPFVWCIGAEAYQLGPTRPQSFVKAVKTRVGLKAQETVSFAERGRSVEVTAEEVCRFILMDLLARTKRALKRRPVRFILTVPTRFTLKRKEILRRTFEAAARAVGFSVEHVAVIDESLAAGLFYLYFRSPADEAVNRKPQYRLMIVDFGGGTTDATIFHVRQKLGADGLVEAIEEIEIIGAWGDPTLGGEAVSGEIAKILYGRFSDQAPGPSGEEHLRRLEDKAEAVKIAVSELEVLRKAQGARRKISAEQLAQFRGRATLTLRASLAHVTYGSGNITDDQLLEILAGYFEKGQLLVSSADFAGASIPVSRTDVITAYDERMNKLGDDLRAVLRRISSGGADQEKVDVLLLAGQSSQFPTVADSLRDLAGTVEFVTDMNGTRVLKECVSRGALIYSFHLKGRVGFGLIGLNRLWTRLGRPSLRFGGGEQFDELLEWGTEYPCETREFPLTRAADIMKGRLRLELKENLSFGNEPLNEDFGTFEIDVSEHPQEKYQCKLRITELGEVMALALLDGNWLPMEGRR